MQSHPAELEALGAVLSQVETPVQIISGRRDAVVPPVNAEYLHDRLPHSELHLIDGTHFVWEDAADEYASLVNAWWGGGFKTCMEDRRNHNASVTQATKPVRRNTRRLPFRRSCEDDFGASGQ